MAFKNKVIIVLILLNLFSWSVIFYFSQDKGLEVCFLNVGIGDAIFIETPFKHQILIDGGSDETVISRLENRMPFWDKTIDLIVLSHPDKDHLFGLIEVLKRYQVKNILWTGIKAESLLYQEWLKAIEKEGAKIWIADDALKIKIAKNQFFDVIYPFESLEGRQVSNKNNSSIVMILNSNQQKVLFTGDAEKQVESWLKEKEINLKSQVLKASHHGSKTGTSIEFLEAVQPEIAIISASTDNRYGLPAKETLANLSEFGIKTLQTSNFKNDICLIQKKKEPFYLLNQMP